MLRPPNLAAFQGEYKGLQLTRIVGSTPFTSNAGSVRLRGLEVESHFVPVAGVSLDANYTYLDNVFRQYNNCASTAVVGCPIFDGNWLAGIIDVDGHGFVRRAGLVPRTAEEVLRQTQQTEEFSWEAKK